MKSQRSKLAASVQAGLLSILLAHGRILAASWTGRETVLWLEFRVSPKQGEFSEATTSHRVEKDYSWGFCKFQISLLLMANAVLFFNRSTKCKTSNSLEFYPPAAMPHSLRVQSMHMLCFVGSYLPMSSPVQFRTV